jgi:hypothetical protein
VSDFAEFSSIHSIERGSANLVKQGKERRIAIEAARIETALVSGQGTEWNAARAAAV